jgi:hypothetical protein
MHTEQASVHEGVKVSVTYFISKEPRSSALFSYENERKIDSNDPKLSRIGGDSKGSK